MHTYVEKSSNQKNLELTFAKAESRRELLKFTSHDHTNVYCEYHTTNNGCLEQVYQYECVYTWIYIYHKTIQTVLPHTSSSFTL